MDKYKSEKKLVPLPTTVMTILTVKKYRIAIQFPIIIQWAMKITSSML